MYALAERLGKTVGELRELMTDAEREGWIAYLGHLEQQRSATLNTRARRHG